MKLLTKTPVGPESVDDNFILFYKAVVRPCFHSDRCIIELCFK